MKHIPYTIFTLLLLTSLACVPMKKYKDLEAEQQKVKITNQSSENQLRNYERENDRLRQELMSLRQENSLQQNKSRGEDYAQNQEVEYWKNKYQNLEITYQQLLNNSNQQAQITQQRLSEKDQELAQLRGNNSNIYTQPGNLDNPNQTSIGDNPNSTNFRQNENIPNNNSINPDLNKNTGNKQIYDQNTTMNNANVDINKLYELQNAIAFALNDYPQNQINLKILNGQLYVSFSDPVLFTDDRNNLSPSGKQALQKVSQVLLQYPNSQLSIESESSQAGEENLGYLKAKSIAQLFGDQGIKYQFHRKNFSPLAYNTTGTQTKVTETTLVLRTP